MSQQNTQIQLPIKISGNSCSNYIFEAALACLRGTKKNYAGVRDFPNHKQTSTRKTHFVVGIKDTNSDEIEGCLCNRDNGPNATLRRIEFSLQLKKVKSRKKMVIVLVPNIPLTPHEGEFEVRMFIQIILQKLFQRFIDESLKKGGFAKPPSFKAQRRGRRPNKKHKFQDLLNSGKVDQEFVDKCRELFIEYN